LNPPSLPLYLLLADSESASCFFSVFASFLECASMATGKHHSESELWPVEEPTTDGIVRKSKQSARLSCTSCSRLEQIDCADAIQNDNIYENPRHQVDKIFRDDVLTG
jgi:hypothetical protein